MATYRGLLASSLVCAWAWSMFENDELSDGGGRLVDASNAESFRFGA
jgi:hypothetical protein